MEPEDDPEERIRELERPLAETARASEMGGTQRPAATATRPAQRSHRHAAAGQLRQPRARRHRRAPVAQSVWWILIAFFIIGTMAFAAGLIAVQHRTPDLARRPRPRLPAPSASQSTAPNSPPSISTQTPAPRRRRRRLHAHLPPAGGNLSVSGINENRPSPATTASSRQRRFQHGVVITGHCTSLNVSGVQNSITVDAVDTIEASGFNNQITYHTGSPNIDKSGDRTSSNRADRYRLTSR